MAAYAALVSLMNTMNHIQIHPRVSTFFNKNQLESLGGTLVFLLDFIESYNYGGRSRELEDLEGQITRAAHAVEDVIESHIVDLILAESTNENLEGEITCAAHEAEDVIESHIVDVDQSLAESTNKHLEGEIASVSTNKKEKCGFLQKMMRHIRKKPMKLHLPCLICNPQKPEDMDEKPTKLPQPIVICDLQKELEDLDSIKENVGKVEMQGRFKHQTQHAVAASSRPVRKTKSMMGFDDYLIHLLDKLTGLPSNQQVIPIIGMGGIGKTTLARNAFDNLLIKQHFDVRAWVTISQNYRVREILLQLLSSQDQEDSTKFVALNEQELGEELHKFLFNRRYLIILDDIWGIDVWDDIKFYFPDNDNGSRIVVTTRLLDIALHFNQSYLTVNLLDEDKSWNLFCQESFGEEGCPAELEKVGKEICENCKGLPLSIVVIGGFLQRSSMSREYWEGVARDTYSILSSEGGNQFMNILSLSYNHLPAHLKPCFLYMGVFAEDDEIFVSRLIKLWVGEGFLRPNGGQSMEEVGEGYLKDLVDRNLILVNRWGSNGQKIRTCNIHDLLRELCLRVAEKEKFLCVMKLVGTPQAINRERRIVIHESMSNQNDSHDLGSASLIRSLICKGGGGFSFRLMRVLSVVENEPQEGFLEAELKSVNLRCLDLGFVQVHNRRIPSLHIPKKISLLWNLQSVIIKGYHELITAPSEIWEMVQLRHVQVHRLYVPDPPPRNDVLDVVLPNLQTLWNALNFRLSEEVCKRIPNIKRLRLVYSELPLGCDAASYYCPQCLGRFHKLESLTLRIEVKNLRHMLLKMKFPSSLKKLALFGGDLCWEDLDLFGSLPNLEVLKLWAYEMVGSEWNPVEEEFRSLKVLEIHSCRHLTKWNADSFHFPVLEKLVLEYALELDEIPSGIGEIPTLRFIRVFNCKASCAFSAVKILEEQESLGNDDLQVQIGFFIISKGAGRFRKMMEEDGFTSNNLHILKNY